VFSARLSLSGHFKYFEVCVSLDMYKKKLHIVCLDFIGNSH